MNITVTEFGVAVQTPQGPLPIRHILGIGPSTDPTSVMYNRLGSASTLSDADIETYLRPLVASDQRLKDFERFLAAFDNKHTLAIEDGLKKLKAPTLIVWGTDDVYFGVEWARWLAGTIPGTKRMVELTGARIFFPEERADVFNRELRAHWQGD